MSGGQLNANVDQYLQAAAMNTPPPQIMSDPLVTGVTPIEQLLRVLGLAANLGDSDDNAKSALEHAERDAKTAEAAEKFAAQDELAAGELNDIGAQAQTAGLDAAGKPDQAATMAQQLPQMASSMAGALAGAIGGALQPLAQIPQQAAQGMQQAMQTGMGLFQQAAGSTTGPIEDAGLDVAPLTEDFGFTASDLAGLGGHDIGAGGGGDLSGVGGAGLGSLGGTAPMSMLGPPPVPSASTSPSSAPITPITTPNTPVATTAGTSGMAGMPMVPPGAMAGSAGSEKDPKADTKRVSVPPVRNGAPVQGRLTTPPSLPAVTKKVDGKPVATRRIVVPGIGADGDQSSDTKSDS